MMSVGVNIQIISACKCACTREERFGVKITFSRDYFENFSAHARASESDFGDDDARNRFRTKPPRRGARASRDIVRFALINQTRVFTGDNLYI